MKSLHCCLVGRTAAGSGGGDAGCFLPVRSRLLSPRVWGGGSARSFPHVLHPRLGRMCPQGAVFSLLRGTRLLVAPLGAQGLLHALQLQNVVCCRESRKRGFCIPPGKRGGMGREMLAWHQVLCHGDREVLAAVQGARCGYTCGHCGFSNFTPWLLSRRECPGRGEFGI